MTQRPESPNPFAAPLGKLRLWGGEGEEPSLGEPDGNDGENSGEADESAKAIKEAQDKADKAEKDAKEAKKRADQAEKALKDKELEGADEAEKTAAERDDYKEKYEKLLKIVETSVVDTAITNLSNAKDKQGNPKYNWQDIEAVRAFLDKENITLDIDTGKVDGLDSQLADIAKKRPYLLVTKEEQDDGSGRTPPPPPNPNNPATGNHPFGGNPRQRETDRGKLGMKYNLPGFRGATNQVNTR